MALIVDDPTEDWDTPSAAADADRAAELAEDARRDEWVERRET